MVDEEDVLDVEATSGVAVSADSQCVGGRRRRLDVTLQIINAERENISKRSKNGNGSVEATQQKQSMRSYRPLYTDVVYSCWCDQICPPVKLNNFIHSGDHWRTIKITIVIIPAG